MVPTVSRPEHGKFAGICEVRSSDTDTCIGDVVDWSNILNGLACINASADARRRIIARGESPCSTWNIA